MLRTSAGQYSSEKLTVRTHKMTDLSGITVTPGVLPAPLRESLSGAVERIGAKMADTVRIDTTHFVCTEGRGREWEKAVEMNIPVVRPEWIEGCERDGRIVGVRGYYLNADPRLRQAGQGLGLNRLPQPQPQPQQQQQQQKQQPQRNPPEPLPQQTRTATQPHPISPSSSNPDAEYHESNSAASAAEPTKEHAPPPPAKDTPIPSQAPVSPISDNGPEGSEAVDPPSRTPGSHHGAQGLRPSELREDEGEGRKSEGEAENFSEVQL